MTPTTDPAPIRRALDALGQLPPVARLALVCLFVVALVYVAVRPAEDPTVVQRSAGATTTTAPSPFGPVPVGGSGVIETEDGLVLPVVGGAEGGWEVLTPCAARRAVDRPRTTGAHIVIDPGHGGEETGAIAPNGLTEAAVNLAVARGVAERLEQAGATVVLTRDTDVRVTIETRAAIARALQPLAFVSIHHNSGSVAPSDRPGVQVFHQLTDPGSRRLGGILFEFLQQTLTPLSDSWTRGDTIGVRGRIGTGGGDFYGILRESAGVPAVLVEALYLSGEPEARLLADPAFLAAEADAISEGIVAWLEGDGQGSGYLEPLDSPQSAGGGGGRVGCEDPASLGAA